MIKKTLVAGTALAAALTSGLVAAETTTTANFAVSSDYIFRGVNYGSPAVSGGIDTAYDSGLYTGAWLSSTNTGSNEVDIYFGFATDMFDVGYIGYFFPGDGEGGNHGNANEIYASTGLGESFSGMVSYGFGFSGAPDDEYAYAELNGALGELDVHLGYLVGLGDAVKDDEDAVDVSVSKTYGDFTAGVSMRFDDSATDDTNEERPNFFVSWGTEFDVAAK
jgi:uncharacterized protein (TIGR02001 family)